MQAHNKFGGGNAGRWVLSRIAGRERSQAVMRNGFAAKWLGNSEVGFTHSQQGTEKLDQVLNFEDGSVEVVTLNCVAVVAGECAEVTKC